MNKEKLNFYEAEISLLEIRIKECRELLSHLVSVFDPLVNIQERINVLTKALGLEPEKMLTQCRIKPYSRLRGLVMRILYDNYGWTLKQIQEIFNRKDHQSIIINIRNAREEIYYEKERKIIRQFLENEA